jgi:hypothetical protein
MYKWPKYVVIGRSAKNKGTTMRLDTVSDSGDIARYWRPAGAWSTDVKIGKDGKPVTFNWPRGKEWGYLNGLSVTEITRKEFLQTNRGYV